MIRGVYRALVMDSRDPDGVGRVRVTIPAVSGDSITDWIYPVINAGYVVTPKAGEQVWVLFEAGDVDNPVWIGKTVTTKTGINKQNKGYATLIDRVETLEDQVATLQSQVSTLQGQVSSLNSRVSAAGW